MVAETSSEPLAAPVPSVSKSAAGHIRLTSHAGGVGALQIRWDAPTATARGPIIGTTTKRAHRNVIGTHSGSYSVYRALAVAAGALSREHKADLTDTAPTDVIGPYPQWGEPGKIVSLDPWGAMVAEVFADELAAGHDMRPTIAVTKAHVILPEVVEAVRTGRLVPDGHVLLSTGAALVTKAAIEPVWYLPGVAQRFGCSETDLRRVLFEETGGMYPELVTRSDLEVFLPPIGGQTLYVFGDARDLADPSVELTARVHDECNGSDVFGSDICTCRPYLTHAIEECILGAQRGGVGLVSYSRKEGRALGEVTKFLVYNARKRQVGGDTADQYFARTECVAGVQDMRFQELMPDVLHWLGVRKIHRLVSMSNLKYDAITGSGIEVRRAGQHSRGPGARRRPRRDRRQDGGRILHAGTRSECRRVEAGEGPRVERMSLRTSPQPHPDSVDGAVALLRTTGAIRERSAHLLRRARAGQSTWFEVDDASVSVAVAEVVDVTRARYPTLDIPFHSRWRHFEAGGVDRKAELDARLATLDAAARARAMIDLTVVSVLLDAGAGPDWAYDEAASGQRFTRSEGLGVASFNAFMDGVCLWRRGRSPARRRRRPGGHHRRRPRPGVSGGARQSPGRHRGPGAPAPPARRRAGRTARDVRATRASGRTVRSAAAHPGPRDGHRARHPLRAPTVAVGYLVGGQRHRRPAARRLLAPPRRAGPRPDARLDALPQAVAVADLFAARSRSPGAASA